MVWGAATGLSVPYEDYSGRWLKCYEQGTTTPISMATDNTGGTTLAKAEVSSGGTVPIGFLKTSGDAILQPWLEEAYDAWLFETEADADANTTANAIQIADNATPAEVSSDEANAILLTQVPRNFATVSDMTANAGVLAGQFISVEDFATGNNSGVLFFKAVAGSAPAPAPGSQIDHDTLPIYFIQNFPAALTVKMFGAVTSMAAAVLTPIFQAALDYAEANIDAVRSVTAPAGIWTLDLIHIPLGVWFKGEGHIETSSRAVTKLLQSGTGSGADVIRFKSLSSGGLWRWYGRLTDFAIVGDTSNTLGFGIRTIDEGGHQVELQDSSIIRDLTIRGMPEGGTRITSGAFPASISDVKYLFNNGPGIHLTRATVVQALGLHNISGDGNNGGLIKLENLTANDNVVITNLKSEFRENADYSSAEHQTNAIVCVNCGDAPITIVGANHSSSVATKKPGNLVQVTGTAPSIAWSGVSIRVQGSETVGSDPTIIGGVTGANPPPYTTANGFMNSEVKLFNSVLQYQRGNNTDLDATPSVAGMQVIVLTNSVATDITDLDDGQEEQTLFVTFADGNTTLKNNANLLLGSDITGLPNEVIQLLRVASTWRLSHPERNFTSTTGSFTNIASSFNTAGKYDGKQAFNTTTNMPVWAVGSAAGDVWVDATGATAHIPSV